MAERTHSSRWTVEFACSLDHVLARMSGSAEALRDGRVFVDGKRVFDPLFPLEPGAFVDVFPAPPEQPRNLHVLSTHENLIAVMKPAGLSTIPDQRGHAASLLDAVAKALGERDLSRVHPTSRLDRGVSGVVVFALGKQAREIMQQARQQNRYQRHYVALVAQPPTPSQGKIDAPIGRGKRPTERSVHGKNAVNSITYFQTIDRLPQMAMVAVEPQTGRTHQIRVHLSHANAPLLGDDTYGGPRRLVLPRGAVLRFDRVALHAAWVKIAWPDGTPWHVEAPMDEVLMRWWSRAGGHPDSWNRAWQPLSVDMGSM